MERHRQCGALVCSICVHTIGLSCASSGMAAVANDGRANRSHFGRRPASTLAIALGRQPRPFLSIWSKERGRCEYRVSFWQTGPCSGRLSWFRWFLIGGLGSASEGRGQMVRVICLPRSSRLNRKTPRCRCGSIGLAFVAEEGTAGGWPGTTNASTLLNDILYNHGICGLPGGRSL